MKIVSWYSGIGGSFFSAMLEDPCTMVVGASGSIYGMMGLYISSCVVNFESIKYPFTKLLVVLVLTVINLILHFAQTSSGISGYSHLGGFIVGLCAGYLFLPNLKHNAWTMCRRRLVNKLQQREEDQKAFARRTAFISNPADYVDKLMMKIFSSGRNDSMQDANLQFLDRPSFWATHVHWYYCLMALMVLTLLSFFVVFPIIIYNSKYVDLKC